MLDAPKVSIENDLLEVENEKMRKELEDLKIDSADIEQRKRKKA